jgi:hypothetical protein
MTVLVNVSFVSTTNASPKSAKTAAFATLIAKARVNIATGTDASESLITNVVWSIPNVEEGA